MTKEELKKIPFHFVSHLAMEGEHCTCYESQDGRLGWCDHVARDPESGLVKKRARTVRHYRIDGNIYKTREKFLNALKDFQP